MGDNRISTNNRDLDTLSELAFRFLIFALLSAMGGCVALVLMAGFGL